mmetsp:Transcript_35876/g.98848  ORF Transcript_35876/g.98848 Transcript_35876/m.98848 type:complete len:241 (-) Transcript_35876:88-810(-)
MLAASRWALLQASRVRGVRSGESPLLSCAPPAASVCASGSLTSTCGTLGGDGNSWFLLATAWAGNSTLRLSTASPLTTDAFSGVSSAASAGAANSALRFSPNSSLTMGAFSGVSSAASAGNRARNSWFVLAVSWAADSALRFSRASLLTTGAFPGVSSAASARSPARKELPQCLQNWQSPAGYTSSSGSLARDGTLRLALAMPRATNSAATSSAPSPLTSDILQLAGGAVSSPPSASSAS